MSKSENRKIQMTRHLFQDALIELLYQKSIYEISVTELCREADLNRSTFYKHYTNVNDVLLEIEDSLTEEGLRRVDELEKAGEEGVQKSICKILLHIRENARIYRLLLNHNIRDGFTKDLTNRIISCLQESTLLQKVGSIPPEDREYIVSYLSSGVTAVLRDWLNADNVQEPERIARLIRVCTAAILQSPEIYREG